MTQIRTGISLKGYLLKETDTIAQELDIPRSQIVSLALAEFIGRYRNKKLLEQINEAYATLPEPDEIENMAIIRSHQIKLGRSD
jgi:metal-responsive CopG/Arc/MetJ family transcriptional regulator